MAKIEKATLEMFEDVCELFVDELPPEERNSTVEKFYRPIFTYSWPRDEEHCGHVLLDNGKVVGFVGSFFVQRPVNGRIERFANLTTWKVKEENRSESIFLLMQFLKQKDLTVTGRTAAKEIFAIQEKLGFRNLDSTMKIVPTFLGFSGRRQGFTLHSDKSDFERSLNDIDQQLYLDHQPYKCRHMLVQNPSRYCYLVFSPVKKRHVRVAHIHYISNLDVFLECLPQIKADLLFKHGIPFIWIEDRFLRGRSVNHAIMYKSRFTHLYRSNQLAREDIDNLYTELVIFNTLENRFY